LIPVYLLVDATDIIWWFSLWSWYAWQVRLYLLLDGLIIGCSLILDLGRG